MGDEFTFEVPCPKSGGFQETKCHFLLLPFLLTGRQGPCLQGGAYGALAGQLKLIL
jgi:hypothetical protein